MITPSFNITATERVLPKLALDFTTSTLDPRISFSRAGNTATRVNQLGVIENVNADVARFDYDPITLQCKGLLIEEARTNILAYTDGSYQNSATTLWANSMSSSATTISPRGVSTELWIVPVGSANIFKATTCTATTTYTLSFYVLLGTLAAGDFKFAVRDDSNGVFIATDIVPSQTPTTTNWTRVIYTFTTPVGCTTVRPYLLRTTSSSGGTVAFSSAQLEAGAFATSYIPTTTTALTRNADVATMTGTNFSDWYNASEGAVFAEFSITVPSTYAPQQYLYEMAQTGNRNNRIEFSRLFFSGATRGDFAVVDTGTPSCDIIINALSATDTIHKTMGAYKINSFGAAVNGGATSGDNSGTVPSNIDLLRFGATTTGGLMLNGWLRKFMYYPQRLINSEIQAFSK